MITLEKTVDIPADRRLHLDMALPESVPSGRTRVILAFSPANALENLTPEPFPPIEGLLNEAKQKAAERYAETQRTGVDPLARFAGSLKDVFPEGGLAYQRSIRDEWPD
jgi:hypothetical protein